MAGNITNNSFFQRSGVKQKIMLVTSGILLVAMMVLWIVIDNIITNRELESFNDVATLQSRQADEIIDMMMNNMSASLETLAEDSELRNGGQITVYIDGTPDSSGMIPMNPEAAGGFEASIYRKFANTAKKMTPSISVVSYGTTDGGFLQYPAIPRKKGYDSRTRDWYKNGMAQPDKTIVTPPFMTSKGVPTIGIFRVVKSYGNQPLGVIGYNVDLTAMTDIINSIKAKDSSFFLLVDKENKILADPQTPENAFKQLSDAPNLGDVAKAIDEKGTSTVEINGKTMYMTTYVSNKSSQYKFVTIEEKSSVLAASSNMRIALTITLTAVLIIGMLILNWLINRVLTPLKELEVNANEVANGNLRVHININTEDEFGVVSLAFNKMIADLNDVVGKIKMVSEHVASGAQNVSESSNALSQGAASQAASVEELSTSISEISRQTDDNTENAKKANELTAKARTQAETSNARMGDMVKAMADINESSSNIAKIIKVIDEIAFQTNILALNAAVEAARAGQHGKGFAVVAEEVRNLAARSAKAAQETTEIIEGSLSKVNEGIKITKETSQALKAVAGEVDTVADLVSGIARASEEQSNALNMINQGVLQVSNVVQSNSASAEETAAASSELNTQAQTLQEAVSKFVI